MRFIKSKYFVIISLFIISTFSFLLIFQKISASPSPRLTIIYPKDFAEVTSQKGKCYIIGQIIPAESKLLINGEEVSKDADGAFIYFGNLKIQEINEDSILGIFDINYSLEGQSYEKRHVVKLSPILKTSPDNLMMFDDNFTSEPNVDGIYLPNEVLNVTVKGTPGCEAFFTLEGFNQKIPMAQTHIQNPYKGEIAFGDGFNPNEEKIYGIYKGHIILPKAQIEKAKVTVYLSNEKYGAIKKTLSGTVSINLFSQYEVAELLESENPTVGRTAPGLGYRLFLSKGTKAIVDGEKSDWYRLKISGTDHIFVPKNSVKILPAGTPPPQSTIEAIRTRVEQNFIRIEIGLNENLPFEITTDIDQKKLQLKIFGATSDIDWIKYDEFNSIIKDIRWTQLQDDVLQITVDMLPKHLWGYYAFYEGNILVIKIKKPPQINRKFIFWGSSIADRKIVIDPGHNPEYGAVGPRGVREKDINLKIALKLKKIIEDKGGRVFFTHQNDPLPLTERKSKVLSFEPDISISIHNNAVPDGVNPLVHNGTSVYYYYPNARQLAKSIHKNLFDKLNLIDFGLYWDNLYMCRINETVAVLIEPAFMIIPEQEKKLTIDSFQEKIAVAIAEGIEDFFDKARD